MSGASRGARLVDVAQIAATILAAGGLAFAGLQHSEGTVVKRAELEAQMQERMIELDRHFVDRSDLRPYFYENWAIPARGERRKAVLGTGEMIIDLTATVASSSELMRSENAVGWKRILNAYFCQSPAVRRDWAFYGGAYSPMTGDLLGGPHPGKLAGWNWKRKPARACDFAAGNPAAWSPWRT